MTGYRSRERGSGSVLVLAGAMVLAAAMLVIVVLGSGYVSRHQAAAAADLAALAAAEQLRSGSGDPCTTAAKISRVNGAELRGCTVDGSQVGVTVAVAQPIPRWLPSPVRRAWAGIVPAPRRTTAAIWRVPVLVDYRLTARFGAAGPRWAAAHTGLDFAAPTGTLVVAASVGRVSVAGAHPRYGNLVVLEYGSVATYYAHLETIGVQIGDRVDAGEVIGGVGATGNATGPHLHFEIRVDGVPIDPEPVLFAGLEP